VAKPLKISGSTRLMDLGSGVVSCGILTTITLDEVLLTAISLNARPTGSGVAQLLVEGQNFNKLQASSSKLDSD